MQVKTFIYNFFTATVQRVHAQIGAALVIAGSALVAISITLILTQFYLSVCHGNI